jgi:hypothetical protein
LFKVQKKQCNQCLFGPNKIVSDARRRQIIKDCVEEDTYFNCHKGTIKGIDSLCCRGFWDAFKDRFNLGRVIQRLGGPKEVQVK